MNITPEFIPAEQPVATMTARQSMSIGLPRCVSAAERRFPLTPEAVRILTDSGFTVRMEADAASTIHYNDNQYTRCGAQIVSHAEALQADIVIQLAPMAPVDARQLRRGVLLLSFYQALMSEAATLRELLRRGVTAVALDMVEDDRGNTPFADILAEIDGRAAMALASSLLADAVHGKGILLGGIAGIVPCEVLIIGSGDTACSAARTAVGLGATVRMMDNDVYRLRAATRSLMPGVIASAFQPRGFDSALQTADVVLYTDVDTSMHVDLDRIDTMKRGVLTFDLSRTPGRFFRSMPTVNLADSTALDNSYTAGRRVCYINAGSAVPRTAAMALSNTFLTMFEDVMRAGSPLAALKLQGGLQRGTLTYMGRAVSRAVAEAAGVRFANITLFLTLS